MQNKLYTIALLIGLSFLGGCRRAVHSENTHINSAEKSSNYMSEQVCADVSVRLEKLSDKEKRLHLKKRRNAVVPIRVTFENTSSKQYQFNPHDINLPLADFKTIIRSLTPSGKAAYSAFVAMVPTSAVIGSIVAGVAYSGPAHACSIPGAGLVILAQGAAIGLGIGVVAGAVLIGFYARNMRIKKRRILAEAEQKYLKPVIIPAGERVSGVLFLKKNAKLPDNIELTLVPSDDSKDVLSLVLKPITI